MKINELWYKCWRVLLWGTLPGKIWKSLSIRDKRIVITIDIVITMLCILYLGIA